jgi:hypothetical protein
MGCYVASPINLCVLLTPNEQVVLNVIRHSKNLGQRFISNSALQVNTGLSENTVRKVRDTLLQLNIIEQVGETTSVGIEYKRVMRVKKQRAWVLLALAAGAAAAIAIFYFLAQRGIGIGCPLYLLTGLRCPGCGNSRAALALLQGDLLRALEMNLLFPLEFGYLLWVAGCCGAHFWKNGKLQYRPRWVWADAVILAVVVLWGICRNFWNM